MAANSSQESSQEALKMLSKYPGRLPVICLQGAPGSSMAELLPDQKKFLVPSELLCDGFKDIIRKHIRERTKVDVRSDFQLLAGNISIDGQMTMQEAYDEYKAENCFLYVSVALGDGDRISLEGMQKQSGISSDARKLLAKHPNNVPVVCARAEGSDAPAIGKNRFLVPCSMPCSEFKATLQKQFSEPVVGNSDAIHLSVAGQFLDGSLSMDCHYNRHGAPDGFLYVNYDVVRVGQISNEAAPVAEEAENVLRTQGELEEKQDACASTTGHASCETDPVELPVEGVLAETAEMAAERNVQEEAQEEVEADLAKETKGEIEKGAVASERARSEIEPVGLLDKESLAETMGVNAEVDAQQEDASLNVEPNTADDESQKGSKVFEHESLATEPIELPVEDVLDETAKVVAGRCAKVDTLREDAAQDARNNPAKKTIRDIDLAQERAMNENSVENASDESKEKLVAGDARNVRENEACRKGGSESVHLPDNDPETLDDVSAVGRTCSSSPAPLSPFWQRDDDTRNTMEPGTGGTQSMQNVPSGGQGPQKRHSTGSPDVSAEPRKNAADDGRNIMSKFPGRVPVLCKKGAVDAPDISRSKFLVPAGMLCSEFKYLIYKQLTRGNGLGVTDTIYLFVTKDVSPKSTVTMGDLHAKYKADDSFLHITYSVENTLGYS